MAIATLLLAVWAAAAPAPELPPVRAWLNVPAPLTPADLRGKVVLLYFADDGSASGRLTTLAVQRVEASLGPGFAAVGVREADPDSLRVTVVRRELSHPVASDPDGAIARAFGVKERPALRLVDARGQLADSFGDSSKFADILQAARRLVREAKDDGVLNEKPLKLALERDRVADGPLAFPTQLFYEARSGRLWVCDTGHNRVAALDKSGRLKALAGNGAVDYRDGSSAEAGFDHPEAVAADGDTIYVADTVNDVVRRVDDKRVVTTWIDQPLLRWPRGLAIDNRIVYAAGGDTHDLWFASEAKGRAFRVAGTGKPGRRDGPLAQAEFEEPAGLAVLDTTLWVADSRAAELRAVDLVRREVRTPSLTGPGAPLKRPEAVAAFQGRLLVADAGDGQIKAVDPKTGATTVFASGLSQPSGVAAVGEEVVVSDTGRSRLLRFDARGTLIGPLAVSGLKPLPPGPPMSFLPMREDVELAPKRLRAGVEDRLELSLKLPPGMELNPRAPFQYRVEEARGDVKPDPRTRKGFTFAPRFPLAVRFTPGAGKSELLLDVDWYYCAMGGKGLCYSASKRFRVAIEGAPAEKSRAAALTAKP